MMRNRSSKQRDASLEYPRNIPKILVTKPSLSLLRWVISILVVGLGGGMMTGWFLIQRHLPPIVEQEISDFLNRPVELGSLQSLSLHHVRFGQTDIATTPTDPSHVSLSALEIAYNPIKFLIEKKLEISITAVNPDVYLEQGKEGQWILTEFDRLDPKNPIKLNALLFKKGDVSLSSYADKVPIELTDLSGQTQFIDNLIKFEIVGRSASDGSFQIAGVSHTQTQHLNLLLQSHQLPLEEISRLTSLPLAIETGKIDANLEVNFKPNTLPRLRGVATLHNLTAKLPNLAQPLKTQGQLRFRETNINFDNVLTQLGSIKGIVKGQIDLQNGYQLTAQIEETKINDIFNTLKISPPKIALSGKVKADLKVKGDLDDPNLLVALSNTEPTKIDRVAFRHFNANLQVNRSKVSLQQFQAIPTVGGTITGKGNLLLTADSPQFSLEVEGKNLPTVSLADLYETSLPIKGGVGTVSTQMNFSGNLKQPNSFKATGKANLTVAGGTIHANHLTYMGGNWQSKVSASNINLRQLSLPLQAGKLQGEFQVSGNIDQPINQRLKVTGNAQIIANNGIIDAQNLMVANGNWQTNLGIDKINLKTLLPNSPIPGNLQGNFQVVGTLESTLDTIQATGNARVGIAQGTINAENLRIDKGQWSTQLTAQNLDINRLFPQLPETAKGILSSQFTLAGNIREPLQNLEGKGQGNLSLKQGAIAAKNITIADGNFTTTLMSEAVGLTQLSPKLAGNLAGEVAVKGKLTQFSPESLQANGEVQFSQGLSYVNRPLTTQLQWDGQRLTLDQVTAAGLSMQGWLDLDFTRNLASPDIIKKFAFEIAAEDFNLTNFPLSLPISGIPYGGKLDFEGTISGTPKTPIIEGDMGLINFTVADLAFEPVLTGKIENNPQKGVKLDLKGKNDHLTLQLDRHLQPQTAAIKQGELETTITRHPDRFEVTTRQLPLALVQNFAKSWINSPNPLLVYPVSGDLSGNFTYDLDTGAIAGQQVTILNPVMGVIQGNQFTGNFHYANQSFALREGQFSINQSQYHLDGQLTTTDQGPKITANLGVKQGNLQDILETLQIFELEDFKRGLKPPKYAKAADLYENLEARQNNPENEETSLPPLSEVGNPKTSLGDRLTQFAEFDTWLQQKQQQQPTASLPPLQALQGQFDGQVSVNLTPTTGIEGSFDLKGQQWEWGQYQLSQFQAKGNWKDNTLTLEPLTLQLKDSLIKFAGQLGNQTQQGQIEIVNIPLDTISNWVDLPNTLDFGGRLNGNITLAGNRDNPQASGKLAVNNPTINQTALDTTEGEFTYGNGQFQFTASSILDRHSDPLILQGKFPYALPFAKVKPEGDRLFLKFQAKNEGLTLLNILSQGQVAWLGGEGKVQLNLSGKVDPKRGIPSELQADGIALVRNATIATQMMPQAPLKDVQGKILFNLDQITVEQLTGQFSGGQVAVRGSLPLLMPTPQQTPLTVQFKELALNVPQLYQGGVTGNLNITGTAIKPRIGGDVQLFNGEILLTDKVKEPRDRSGLFAATELTGLRLSLADNIVITRPPILTFLASGNLTLNGTLNQPEPEGQINLKNGLVNLFASQLRLAGGKDNTAQFFPHKGLDPYLNVRLFTSATETNNNTVSINPASPEIDEPFSATKDSLETVRIQAQVQGFASQITQSIELSSQPKRDQQQIISLLGGSVLNTLGTGETTLGLANLAGTAVLGPVQGAIGEALGLNEFRIFPTPLIDEENRLDPSSIGVAAEAGLDLTQDFSLSIQKIVNSDRPPRLGLQYRLNDSTTLRGSSNFADDNRGSIQFEKRF